MSPAKPDLIDPRQREAAALLLMAIDLPAEAGAWCEACLQAARVCPGIKTEQIIGDRPAQLRRVRDLVDQLLSEIGA